MGRMIRKATRLCLFVIVLVLLLVIEHEENQEGSITITSTSMSMRLNDMDRRLPAIVFAVPALDLSRRMPNTKSLA